MIKFVYSITDFEKEISTSKKPIRTTLLFIATLIAGGLLTFIVLKYLDDNFNRKLLIIESEYKRKTDALLNQRDRLRDSLNNQHNENIFSLNQKYEQNLFDLRNEINGVIYDNFIDKTNYILEAANSDRFLPDSITAYFNTLHNDRPLLQISNYTQFPNSSLQYNYETKASKEDIITLYFWIHNTSYNDAINPYITVTAKKARGDLICFTAKLSASNTNYSEYGSAFLSFDPEAISSLIVKDLFCFKVLDINVYESKMSVNNKTPIKVYSYPESFCFNSEYNIYTSNIPALIRESNLDDWFYNQYTIVMRISPIYSG